jgi:AraC-like DNA-binding protein
MFLNIISFLVGFLCLFVMMLMLFNSRLNRKTNIYLIIILFLVGLQRFLNGIELLELTEVIYSPLKIRLSVAFFIVPVYYLFFNRLIRGTSNLKKELLHFILPIVFVSVDVLIVNYQLNYYIYLIFSAVYFGLILNLVFGLINNKKRSMFEKGSYETIRTWTILMCLITFSLLLFSNYFLFNLAESRINLSNFYRFSSLLWLIALIYIFKNPIIIFGEHTLLKSIQINEPQEFLIWSRKPLKSIEQKDAVLSTNISTKVDTIILSIQKLQKSSQALSIITFTASNLAKELKIPRSHVEFVFKYYCHYSINDFSNLIKINYAVSLINEGYLEKYTIASLGDKCLFNSRFTFSKNFKKFMGVSVSDYVLDNSRSGKLVKGA